MCSNIRLSRSKSIVRGGKAAYKTSLEFTREGTFGIHGGVIYNVRSEKVGLTGIQWSKDQFRRGIIDIISFNEGADFKCVDDVTLHVAVLYNDNGEFMIMTENSAGVVAKVHPRMPVIIDNNVWAQQVWFNEGKVVHLKPSLLIRA